MLTLDEVLNDFAVFANLESTTVNVNSVAHDGTTPLHFMAYLGDTNAIQLLLLNGANIDATDNQGNTALQEAIISGQMEVVKQLTKQHDSICSNRK